MLRPSGFALLCEETNAALRFGDTEDERGLCAIGRPVEVYAALLAPLRLVAKKPRRVEPTYPRKDVGTYMLFQAP